jgi:predicted nucleotidyltransferase component of viral defense system
MLSKEDLQKFRVAVGFNLGQVEKDYLQHLFLLFLGQEAKKELVFKGGTALQKIYGLNRFSIDLDFTSTNGNEEKVIKKVAEDITNFGFKTTVSKTEEVKGIGKSFALKIKGPLYDGTEKSLTSLRIEISLRRDLLLEPEIKEIIPIYPDIRPYIVLVMRLEEILAEKVRAIFWRSRARDVYDLWFLVKKGVSIKQNLLDQKLRYYELKFSLKSFEKKINEVEKSWEKELKQITTFVPEFKTVKKEILENFGR